MASRDGDLITIGDPSVYVTTPASSGPTATSITYYKLQGYRHSHSPAPDYETWVGTSLTTPNPSTEPVSNIAVVATWTVAV